MNVDDFRALYDHTAADLLKFLLRRSDTAEDAADSLAETFLIAWSKRHQLPADRDRARPWLFGVARNVLKRHRERGAKASAAVEALAHDLEGYARDVPPDDSVILALSQLSAIDREIIEMLAWDQLPPRDVAAILDLSPNVVRIRAHRARLRLRDLLRTNDPTSPHDGQPQEAVND